MAPPPAARSSGSAARVTRKGPSRSMEWMRRQTSNEVSASGRHRLTPAELTSPSTPPSACPAASTASCTEASSVTSQVMPNAPFPRDDAPASPPSRSSSATRAPSAKKEASRLQADPGGTSGDDDATVAHAQRHWPLPTIAMKEASHTESTAKETSAGGTEKYRAFREFSMTMVPSLRRGQIPRGCPASGRRRWKGSPPRVAALDLHPLNPAFRRRIARPRSARGSQQRNASRPTSRLPSASPAAPAWTGDHDRKQTRFAEIFGPVQLRERNRIRSAEATAQRTSPTCAKMVSSARATSTSTPISSFRRNLRADPLCDRGPVECGR